MMHTVFAFLNRNVVEKEAKVTKVVYRDELTKQTSTPSKAKAVKKRVRFADAENEKKERCGGGNDNELGGNIRVKVKMTKKEAARLLSKCKEGGVLEFKDVACQLAALPLNRVTILSVLPQP